MLFWQKENIIRAPFGGPDSSGIKQNITHPSEDETLKFNQYIEEEVNRLYKKDSATAKNIISGLKNQFQNKKFTKDRENFFSDIKQSLKARDRAFWQHSNVLRKKKEAFKSQSDAGKLDVYTLVPEMQDRMGFDPIQARWQIDTDKYGPKYNPIQSDQQIIDSIINDGNDVLHTRPLERGGSFFSTGYNRYLHLAGRQTDKAIKENSEQIESLASIGQLKPPKPEPQGISLAANKTYQASKDAAYWGARNSFESFRKLYNYAGRGIWSKSDPLYNSSLQRYYDNRDRALSNLLWNVNPAQSKNSELLKRLQNILAKSRASTAELENENGSFYPSAYGLLDEETFNKLSELITKELSKQDASHSSQMADFNNRIQEINSKVLEISKEKTKDEDEMWKWRLFQLALIVTPFAGLSIMGPISNIFSGVFMNPGGLIQGIASLPSQIPGLGELYDLLRIEDAIDWLLGNTPVVKQLLNVSNELISSNIVQGLLGGALMPLANSPITPIAISGLFSLFRLNAELAHRQKYGDSFKSCEDSFKQEIEKISKEACDAQGKWNASDFVEKKFELLHQFNQRATLVDYLGNKIRSQPDLLKKIMGDDFFEKLKKYERTREDGTTIKAVDDNGKILETELMGFIDKDSNKKEYYDKILLYSALERKAIKKSEANIGDTFGQINEDALIKDYQAILSNISEAKNIIEDEKKLRKEDYILQIAIDNNIDCKDILSRDDSKIDLEERSKKIAELETKIKKSEEKFLKTDALGSIDNTLRKRTTPLSVVEPIGHLPFLHNNKLEAIR